MVGIRYARRLMETERVERVVSDITADFERMGGALPKSRVERLLEKRELTVDECIQVYRLLEDMEIVLVDEEGATNNDATSVTMSKPTPLIDNGDWGGTMFPRSHEGKLLTAEEEVELFQRVELGRRAQEESDQGIPQTAEHVRMIERAADARQQIITSNLRLVLFFAKDYVGLSDLSLEDMFQEGTFGLMRAVEKFNYKLGFRFSTYASWWIRQSVMRALSDRGAMIRLPANVHEDVLRLRRAQRLLYQIDPDRRPSIRRLADELNWPMERVQFIQEAAEIATVSIDAATKSPDGTAMVDLLPARMESPDDAITRAELKLCIDRALDCLKQRDRVVIGQRFGLDGHDDKSTLEEIGQALKLTRERIRQIEKKAIEKLRHSDELDALREFADDNTP